MNIIQDFIPVGRPNRPGTKLSGPKYITIHDTANQNPGANALSHAQYLKGDSAASRPVSWHFTVDDTHIVQHLPLSEVGWHAGDGNGPGNSSSIGIEICENIDGDRSKAEANAAELVAFLLRQYGLALSAVVQHNHWTGKNCPHVIRSRPGGWQGFLDAVQNHLLAAGTPIAGPAQATVVQAQEWARQRKADQAFIDVAPIYWQLAAAIGIRPEVAYSQAAKETAFGRFGGVVTRDFHNWCGLKTTQGGSNSDPNAHARFPDDETGVLAHLQHLALYAGVEVTGKIVDPRHFLSIRGTATTVEALGGKWAPSPDYGQSIVRDYLTGLLSTKVSTPPVDNPVEKPHWAQRDHDELRAAGFLLNDHTDLDAPASKGIVFALANRLRKEIERCSPTYPQQPEEPKQPEEPQPPTDPEPTPEPEPEPEPEQPEPEQPEPETPANYPSCFLGLPGPCKRDDGTIDWKGQTPPPGYEEAKPKPQPEPDLPSWDETIERVKDATVYLSVKHFNYGTGWHIGNGYIITAAHVVHNQDELYVWYRNTGKRNFYAQKVAIHPLADLAIYRVPEDDRHRLPVALQIARELPPEGTELALVGHEKRDNWVHETGGKLENPRINANGKYYFTLGGEYKADGGNSGGPVFTQDGTVVGILILNDRTCVDLTKYLDWIEEHTK